MGWFDSLIGGVGDLFGGGGNGGPIDWSTTTPFDATTVAGGFTPSDIFNNVSGLVDTPGALSGWGDLLSTGGDVLGGLLGGGNNSLLGTGVKALTGGGNDPGSGGGTPTTVSPLTVTAPPRGPDPTVTGVPKPATNVPGLTNTPQYLQDIYKLFTSGGGGTTPTQGKTPGTGTTPGVPGGGNPVGVLSGILSGAKDLAPFAALMAAINSKDSTNLGPDADALRALATGNQNTINSLQAEAQAEKMGNLPGPAMATVSRNLEEQKASMATSYSRMGMSGSSAEAADMAALNQKAEGDRFQIGLNMANEGLAQVSTLTGQDVSIYSGLMTAQAERDKEYMDAMSKLADGLGRALTGTGAGPAGGAPAQPQASPTQFPTIPGIGPSAFDPTGILAKLLAGDTSTPMVTPVSPVQPLINTPDSLPAAGTLDNTGWNPDQVAASDFLQPFIDFSGGTNPGQM